MSKTSKQDIFITRDEITKFIDEEGLVRALDKIASMSIDLEEYFNQFMPTTDKPLVDSYGRYYRAGDSVQIKAECKHEWKAYQGLVESYNYCTKCDKKDVDNK